MVDEDDPTRARATGPTLSGAEAQAALDGARDARLAAATVERFPLWQDALLALVTGGAVAAAALEVWWAAVALAAVLVVLALLEGSLQRRRGRRRGGEWQRFAGIFVLLVVLNVGTWLARGGPDWAPWLAGVVAAVVSLVFVRWDRAAQRRALARGGRRG